ncbi:hypothetical protein [Nitrosococcus watsonii]|uniref:hypothetical protein n=1 Tax=Nitrosococcus watsonii TaxID=473531 RepID=UPI00067428F5|nr:hypothetical protein [Nitrosococcus watsonii]
MDSIETLRKVLSENPRDEGALRSFGDLLTQRSRRREVLQCWSREFMQDQKSLAWLQKLVAEAMRSGSLWLAGQAAELYALLRWGAQDYTEFRDANIEAPSERPIKPYLTHPKLRHDIEHFTYLGKKGILDSALLLRVAATI